MVRVLLSICLLIATLGCNSAAVPLAAPVPTTGTVVGGDGKPVGNVVLNLQPLENGYVKNVDVKADGTFSVETQAGKYAYSFSPKTGTKALPAAATKYSQASMDRTVQIASGKSIEIKLE